MNIGVIIAAGGIGQRMGGNRPKQFLEIAGQPIIHHTLQVFQNMEEVKEVVIVLAKDYVESFQYQGPKHWQVIPGGKQRQDSVSNGLKVISDNCEVVLIHDAARPFISQDLIKQVAKQALNHGAAILACPIKETIKMVNSQNTIIETIDRSKLWAAQTPQGFELKLFRKAMQAANEAGYVGTDDASLVERLGNKVHLVEGDSRNIKITTPEDLVIAEAIAKGWKEK
ncbi:MAG: 2-C-methyl-D-erythritol 4-phosphate cytidylyltransferase [Pseudomonadota bacterium]